MVSAPETDDDLQATLETRIQRGAGCYARKFGRAPTTVHIHPDTLGIVQAVAGIEIVARRSMLRNHFWFGVETEAASAPALPAPRPVLAGAE